MKAKITRWLLILAAGFFWLSVIPALAQDSQILWSAFAAGFGASSSANTSVTTAVGQSLVGASSDGNTGITSGFLADTTFTGPVTAVEEERSEPLPGAYELEQNYPNPFNPTTRIEFALPKNSHVRLTIYDLLGREVLTLIDDVRPAGNHVIEWNGFDALGQRVSSGIYFFRIEAEGFIQTRKLTLLK
jgi:hypothetical protein